MVQVWKPGQDFTGEVRIKGVDAQFWLKLLVLRSVRRGIRLLGGMEVVYFESEIWEQ